jgi:hypothetical protein
MACGLNLLFHVPLVAPLRHIACQRQNLSPGVWNRVPPPTAAVLLSTLITPPIACVALRG